MIEATAVTEFWDQLTQATDPTAYKPARNEQVSATRLEAWDEPYYNLKRYQTLPIGPFNSQSVDLRAGHFLQDIPTKITCQG